MIKTSEIFSENNATEKFGMRLSKSDIKFLRETSEAHSITQSKVVRTALRLLKEQLENE